MLNYFNGIAPIVSVYGPGNLHHLSYDSNNQLPNAVGIIAAANEGATHFALGFSYTFTGYAFYWDGAGPAFWQFENSSAVEPVGTSWTNATGVPWGTEIIQGLNVESQVQAAVNRDEQVTVYKVPGGLD